MSRWLTLAGATVVALTLASCGHRQVGPQGMAPPVAPDGVTQPALPEVLALDSIFGDAVKSTRNGDEVVSTGAEMLAAEGNYDAKESALNLRAIETGTFSYALYGQDIGAESKPVWTNIEAEPSNLGGGRDDEIPLSFLMGLADYSIGSWRWFGPFATRYPSVPVNNEELRSRFTSPMNNYYLVMLAVNGSKSASALPEQGFISDWPLPYAAKATSGEDEDPGGVRLKRLVTNTAPGDTVPTVPAAVRGLAAASDESGITLSWLPHPEPDVVMCHVYRREAGTEQPLMALADVDVPDTAYKDATAFADTAYEYAARAINGVGASGWALVGAMRPSGPAAPTVLSVRPTSGYSDAATTFRASVTGSAPLSYAWDFAGSATPDTSVEATPTVTLGDEGSYECSLTVSNAQGEETYYFSLKVTWIGHQPPEIASVSPTSGMTGAAVQFTAWVTGTWPLAYAWDFGGGAIPDTSTDASPTATLGDLGDYAASLTVTNPWGEDSRQFTLSVTETGPQWHEVTVDGMIAPYYTCLAEVNGKPAIAYGADDGLRYAQANDPNGATWQSPMLIHETGAWTERPSIAIVNGNPAIGYYVPGLANGLMYVRAQDENGDAWNDPVRIIWTDGNYGVSLAVVNGNPALAYIGYYYYGLKFIRASDEDGVSWPTEPVAVDEVECGECSLAVVNGNPAISYSGQPDRGLLYVRANDAGGANWGAPIAVDPGQSKALFTSLKVVEGRPAIGYHGLANPTNFLSGVIKYVRASDASGTTWGTPVEVDSPLADRAGYQVTLAIIGGKPAIGYFDDYDEDYTEQTFLRLATASDTRGEEWEAPQNVAALWDMVSYGYASIAEVNGHPAVCAAASTLTFYIYY